MAMPGARGTGATGPARQLQQHAQQQHASVASADTTTTTAAGTIGGFGQSLAQEVDNATAKWMKMISSTFLGESASSSLFARRAPALTASAHESSTTPRRRGNMRELKIALVGGSAVGKTSIVRRWLQRSYPSQYSPTIGVDVHAMPFKHKSSGEDVLLHLWDVSSAEVDASAAALHALICDDLDGVFFVFNVHRVSSIAAVDKWRHCLAKHTSARELPFFLLSHKADLLQKRVMTSDDIASYARTAGYRGWMWTVGRSNFGENDKHPAVIEALERMVDLVLKARDTAEQARTSRNAVASGIFASRTSVPLEIVETDDALHQFSAALLRIPTQAITTIPRGDIVATGEHADADDDKDNEDHEDAKHRALPPAHLRTAPPRAATADVTAAAVDYGGNWILGHNKGVYLRATNDSFVANDETEDEVTEPEVFTFPFASVKRLDGESESEREDTDETDGQTDRDDRHVNDNADGNARHDGSSDESDDDDDEARLQRERVANDRVNDELAWRFFAGSIDRARTEQILADKEEGTFLLRRKDAQTLILSYVGAAQIHHVLIEYTQQKYHIGSSKTSQAAFATLWKCLRSVRRYAFRGLIFTRNTDFRVVNKPELAFETGTTATGASAAVDTQTLPVTPSIWRTRTHSSSSSSLGDRSSSASANHHVSPRQPPRLVSGLQAAQEQVRGPPQPRIDELRRDFYSQLTERLAHLASGEQSDSAADVVRRDDSTAASGEVHTLLQMVEREKSEQECANASVGDAEIQWRQLVKTMESWNRIVMNLELQSLRMQ